MIRKCIALVAVVTILGLGGFLTFYWSEIAEVRRMAPRVYAKLFCSCFYVMEKPETYCHKYSESHFPISDFRIDPRNQVIRVEALGRLGIAYFVSEREGCRLENGLR